MLPSASESVLAVGLEFLVVNERGQIVADYQFLRA